MEDMKNTSFTFEDYPLIDKHPDKVTAMSGKNVNDITLEAVENGQVSTDDGRISSEVLLMQAEIAESRGDRQIAFNLRRAAELTKVPDEFILEVYNSIRPAHSSKEEILLMADRLEHEFGAKVNADFVREAAAALESMNGFRKD